MICQLSCRDVEGVLKREVWEKFPVTLTQEEADYREVRFEKAAVLQQRCGSDEAGIALVRHQEGRS